MGDRSLDREEIRQWAEIAIKAAEKSLYPFAEIIIDSNGLQLNFLERRGGRDDRSDQTV